MPSPTKAFTQPNLWIKFHSLIGLTVGLLFSLIGITGSLSIYHDELDELFNPLLKNQSNTGPTLPLDTIMASVRFAHPSRHGEWILEMPRTPHGMLTAWYEKPHETFGEYYAPLMVLINPYTAEVIDSRFWGDTFTTWIYNLHTQLLRGYKGAWTVGILGLAMIVSVVSGLYLCWKTYETKKLRLFSVKTSNDLMGISQDIHRMVGLLTALPLLLLSLTGVHLAFPEILETVFKVPEMSHGSDSPRIRSTAKPNDHPISPTEAIVIARGLFPHAEVRRISIPVGDDGIYKVNLRRPEERNVHHPYTMVWVDRWSGQIREVLNPNKFTFGQDLISKIYPIHSGENYTTISKLLWFLIGFSPALMYMSGLTQWLIRCGFLKTIEISTNKWLQAHLKKILK